MGLFRRKKEEAPKLPTPEQLEEQSKNELERWKQRTKEKTLEDKLGALDRFPGSLQEYMILKREEGALDQVDIVVPMSTGRPKKFVYDARDYYSDDRRLLLKLIDNGCIALIRYQTSEYATKYDHHTVAFGIPVKIKNNGPYR